MLARYDGCKYRRGLSNLARTLGLPGTEIAPIEVAEQLGVQVNGFTWVRLFGGPGDLKGDVAEAVIPIALVVGVAVAIFLRHPFQQVQGAVDIPSIQGDLDQERGVSGRSSLLQEREQLRSKRLPAIETCGKIAQFLVAPERRLHAE